MKVPAILVLTYATFVFLGGITGFILAKSIPSLFAGVVFGLLIALNGYRMLKGKIKGQQIALIQAIVLGSFFVYRYQTTQKLMPAIPMVILSFALALFLLIKMPKKGASEQV